MKQVFLISEKVYGPQKELALRSITSSIRREISGLQVKLVSIDIAEKGWLQLVLEGEDAEAARNFLSRKHSLVRSLEELRPGLTIRGKLVEPKRFGYGLYVDIGLPSNEKDAFIPLYTLRRQLLNNIRKPLRVIVDNFALIENFPLEVKILNINREKGDIEAELSENQAFMFKRWVNSSSDRIIVCGSTRQQVRKAVIKSGHLRDIVSIERLGLLEHVVICKYGSDGPGLIYEIGKFLPDVPMKGFLPKNIKALIG
ncbi:MAG: DUF2110 family protein [Candidatus Jordarchaeaceae archaeon]